MPAVFSDSGEQFSCKLCSHSSLQRAEVSSHLERKHSVISRDWNFMLTLMNTSAKVIGQRSSLENSANARGAGKTRGKGGRAVKGRSPPQPQVPKSGTRYDGEDDFDMDWTPGQKRQSFRKVGQHFKCNDCSRLFKREGQFDRHRCFGGEEGSVPIGLDSDFTSISSEEPEYKRKKAETYPANKGSAQMYKKIIDAKTTCLEEGSYFYRMKKDLDSVLVDVDAKTNKVEVQVSIEGDTEEIVRDMFQCRECSAVLPTKEEATCHVKGHLPTHHFCCKFCPDRWRFTNDFLGSVLKHVRSSHPGKADLSRCVRCGFTANRDSIMDEHMVKRHPPHTNYTCTHCSAEFGLSILGLVNHVKIEHSNDSSLLESVVTEAKTVFKSEDIFECNLCEKVFFTKAHIEAHKEAHTNGDIDVTDDEIAGILRCCHCKYESITAEELRMHINATHKHLYCKLCDAHIFAGSCFSESLINHILVSHDTQNDSDTSAYVKQLTNEAYKYYSVSNSFRCKICPKIFFSRRAFADHMRVHDGGYVNQFTCEACGVHKTSKGALRRHVRTHRFLYFCPECVQFFTSNQSLQEHLIGCHSESDELPCDAYKRSLVVSLFLPTTGIASSVPLTHVNNDFVIDYFKGKQSNLGGDRFDFPKYVHNSLNRPDTGDAGGDEGYDSPMEAIEGIESNQPEDATESPQGTTILLVTGEEGNQEQIAIELPPGTDGAQTLRELGLSVDGLNLPTASGGSGRVDSNGKLEVSLDSPFVLVGNTEFCLALAQHQFCWMTEDTLAGLMKSYGDMECLYCGKFYHTPSKFALHQNIHTKIKQYKCSQCEYFCHHFQLLKYHMDRTHGTENLQCNECEFASTSKLKFAQHMKKHAPKAEYKCSKCGMTSESEGRMREHFSMKHPALTVDEISLQMGSKRKSSSGSGLKIEPCKYCGKVFEVNALEKHLWLHEDVNPYKCDICDFSGRSKAYLAVHMQSHEDNDKRFTCKICSMAHKSEKALISHIVANHFENNTCPQCAHVAANRGDFHCHLLIHSEKKSFACNICPTVLLQEARMEEHFRVRHYGVRVQYTSFINENPISIQDIAELAREAPAASEELGQQPTALDSSTVDPTKSGTDEVLGDSGLATIDGSQPIGVGQEYSQQQMVLDPMIEDAQAVSQYDQASEEAIHLEIDAAINALVEAGHIIPEGAEIMIDNGTILIDGVPTAIITTDDGQQQPEQIEQQIEHPTEQGIVPQLLEEMPADVLAPQSQMPSQEQVVTQEQDTVVPQLNEESVVQQEDIEAGATQGVEGDEEDPNAAGYISLDNLDLASLNLPPGNYNLALDEHGQTVIIPTDTIDENTIQVIAQE